MKPFQSDELATFLRAVDQHLPRPLDVVVIGGAAAALAFGAESGTLDIDLCSISCRPKRGMPDTGTVTRTSLVEKACQAARKETGLAIPMGQTPVFDAPYEYASRLQALPLKGLVRLKLFVPEKHDWAFMKIVRLLDKDIEDVKEIASSAGFDKEVFLKRFLEEMTHIEPAKRLVDYFVAMMEELYGKKEADRMEKEIRGKWKMA